MPKHNRSAQSHGHCDHWRKHGLHLASFECSIDRRVAYLTEFLLFEILTTKGLHDSHGFEALLDDRNNVALPMPHLMGSFLYRLLKPRHEEQQNWSHGHCHEGKVPIEPEHETEHPDNRQQIDKNTQGRRRCEVLNRLDVIGNGAQQLSSLMAVVISQRQALQMVVGSHAEIMCHPLADALGVVVIDV